MATSKERELKLLADILDIQAEEERRYRNGALKRYNKGKKVHQKQMAFHRCLKRNRWVFGGNRSGKTECGAVEAVWWARGIHPYRTNRDGAEGWVVSLSYEVQRDVAQAKILRYLDPDWIEEIVMSSGRKEAPSRGIIDYMLIKNVFGGLSKIAFKSCDQGREKFQGASLDFVWFDEEPPLDIYRECKMRVLDKCGEIWGTMTPLKGLTWVYDEIYMNSGGDPEVWHEHIEWSDNPFLDKREIERVSASLDESELAMRRYGRFSVSEGAVYREFDPSRDVVEPFDFPKEWQENVSIDPGLRNPLACLFFAVDWDGVIYVVGEWYEAGREIGYHADKILDLADKLDWKRGSDGRLHALIDSAAGQRTLSGSKSVAELFFEHGIAVDTRVNKELWSGIARVKQYFAEGRIKIFSCCDNLIRELKSYWWGTGDSPVKKDDHALDALRYFVMSRPQPARRENGELTIVQKDKQKLIRAHKRNLLSTRAGKIGR